MSYTDEIACLSGMKLIDSTWGAMGFGRRRSSRRWEIQGGVPGPSYRGRGKERRWATLGATEGGRLLFVVVTRRANQRRVVAARDTTDRETRRYRRRSR